MVKLLRPLYLGTLNYTYHLSVFPPGPPVLLDEVIVNFSRVSESPGKLVKNIRWASAFLL